MTSPSSKHKPYTTGARPSTTAAKANVHMTGGGWVRTITATDYAWAGNDNVNSDQEVLVAFRGTKETGWYAYTYWVTKTPSEATPVAISVHVHFQEAVDVTGSPTITITNTKDGGGSATTKVATYVSGTGGHRLLFTTAVPSANQFKEDDLLYIGIDALALAGGTIKDAGTTTNSLITNAAVDTGYNGSLNRGGNYTTAGVAIADGPRLIVEA